MPLGSFSLACLRIGEGTATELLKSQLRPFDLLRNTNLEIQACDLVNYKINFREQTEVPGYIAALKANARRSIETVGDCPTSDAE